MGSVTIYDPQGERDREFDAETVRTAAKVQLGMVDGPFEVDLFTRQILARSIQREQIEANERLKAAYTVGGSGNWREAMKEVAAINDLMERLGIEDAKWDPAKGGATVTEPPRLKATKGEQVAIEGQDGLGF